MSTRVFNDVETNDAMEAMEASDHDFRIATMPLTLPNGMTVPDKVATVDIGHYPSRYLGTVGKGYKVIQPEDFYGLAQKFIDQTGANITRTMTLKNGAVLGINFLMDTKEYLPGDPIEMNFLMLTSFNMQYSLLGRAISSRLFCLNQLPSSHRLFDIKHTTYAYNRLEMAMKMVGYFGKEQKIFDQKMDMLTKCRMTTGEQLSWFSRLFPVPAEGSKRSETIALNRSNTFLQLLEDGKGANVPGIKGTAYQALNALTEYANHFRPTRIKDNRNKDAVKFEAITFGSGSNLMQRGFDQMVELAKTKIQNRFLQVN